MESTDSSRPLAKLSPFALQKGIQGLAGEVKNVTRLRSGQVLVEVDKKSHSDNLLRSAMIIDVPMRVSPHKSLNYKKGIIRSRDLKGCSDEEILESDGAKQQGITGVKRFKIKKQGQVVDTNTFLITFGLPTLPKCVKLAYLNIPVETHIPNPMRCFVCQRFGHTKYNCRRQLTCARCGTEGHDDSSCEAPHCCVNCKEAHSAYSKDCPMWKKEKAIQRIKCTTGVSFLEARKIVEASVPALPSGHSYAKAATSVAVKKTTRTCETQTVVTWPEGEKPKCVQSKSAEVQTEVCSGEPQSRNSGTAPLTKKAPKMVGDGTAGTVVAGRKPEVSKKTINQEKPKKKPIHHNRQQKGSEDPVAEHNRFDVLEVILNNDEMDFEFDDAQNQAPPSKQQPKPP